jgi:fatty acid-binding protein DegV
MINNPLCQNFPSQKKIDYLTHGKRIGKLVGTANQDLNLRPLIVFKKREIFPGGIA